MMDQKLKQRLVGAVVLVSLAVIFIPIILEGPDDEWSPRVQEMPVPPRIDYRTEVDLPVVREVPPAEELPAATPEATPAKTPVPPPPVVAEEPAVVKQPLTAPPPAAAAPPVAEAPPAAPPPKSAAAAVPAGGWVIQVGSFSQQLNARGLRDRLGKSGYQAFLQQISAGSGKAYRVLVGPLEDRPRAEKLRDELRRKHQLKGIVIENPK